MRGKKEYEFKIPAFWGKKGAALLDIFQQNG